jgi:hypothetical protein
MVARKWKILKKDLEILVADLEKELERIMLESDDILSLLPEEKQAYYYGRLALAFELRRMIRERMRK